MILFERIAYYLRETVFLAINVVTRPVSVFHYLRFLIALRKCGLLGNTYYMTKYEDVRLANIFPWRHYFFFGYKENRDPVALFQSHWYCEQYVNDLPKGTPAFCYYLLWGLQLGHKPHPLVWSEWPLEEYTISSKNSANEQKPEFNEFKDKLQPNPYFDIDWYLSRYTDVERSGMDPLSHYLEIGQNNGYEPNPVFDSFWYLEQNEDVAAWPGTPFEHFIAVGDKEGRMPSPYFDSIWYATTYLNFDDERLPPFLHYLIVGTNSDKHRPNPYFDESWYQKTYSPDCSSGQCFKYFLHVGQEQGHEPGPLFDSRWYCQEYLDDCDEFKDPFYHYLRYGLHCGNSPVRQPDVPSYRLVNESTPALSPVAFIQSQQSFKELLIDIVLVTYNSSKWVVDCLDALLPVDQNVTVTVVDNNSTDNTIDLVRKYEEKFSQLRIITNDKNVGFGAANNIGAVEGANQYIFFLNIDTQLNADNFIAELSDIAQDKDSHTGAWELRQLPYEHPKCYDPVTWETGWCSAAALIVRREAFEAVGGFDENIFMYCEDVDLSWRLRAAGWRLRYCPHLTVLHHSYDSPGEKKPNAHYYGTLNNYYLRLKFGTDNDCYLGKHLLINMLGKAPDKDFAEKTKEIQRVIQSVSDSVAQKVKTNSQFVPVFRSLDYDIVREGAFYHCGKIVDTGKVSIIIRTVGKLHFLREALSSALSQTYKNIEVIVVEDGSEKGKQLVIDCQDNRVVYHSIEKSGRCVAGNVGLEVATGSYINFLDEDDLLYADHVASLLSELGDNEKYGAVWGSAFCVKTQVNEEHSRYTEKEYILAHVKEPTLNELLDINHFPIQAVLFRRDCYEELGGFDVNLELMEDWDLWIRYFSRFLFKRVKKTTSLYRVPHGDDDYTSRKEELEYFENMVHEKHLKLRQ